MFLKEVAKKHPKKLAAGAAAAVLCTAMVAVYPAMAMSMGGGGPEGSSGQGLYKESPVTRGDVTVGITETGTASLESIAITYDDYSAASSDDSTTVKALVEEVYVKAGQRVSEGDPIARLSTDDIQESLDTLKQDRKAAQLALDKAKIDQQTSSINAQSTLDQRLSDAQNADVNYEMEIDQSSSGIASAKNAMLEAETKLDDANDALDAFEAMDDDLKAAISAKQGEIDAAAAAGEDTSALEAEKAALQQELDDYNSSYNTERKKYHTAYSSASNSYSSAKLKYELAVGNETLDEKTAEANRQTALSYEENAQTLYDLEIAQLANSVDTKALALENIDKKIAKLEAYLTDGQVKATCDGLVMNVYVVAGDKVNPNATLASLANSQNIYISVSIDQEDISTLELGRSANVTMDAFADKKFTGKVDSMSTTPAMTNSSTVNYNIKVKLDNPDDAIFEGMTASVTFVTEEVKDVLTVSSKAVYTEGDKSYVKVKAADGTITPVEVEVGLKSGTLTEIKSGLNEGDIAIIESKVGAAK